MKTFKQFISSVKSVYERVANKIRSGLNSLGFGEKITIDISSGIIYEAKNDFSKLGYYSEFVAATHLLTLLHKSKYKIKYEGKRANGAVNSSSVFAKQYKKDKLSTSSKTEIKTQEAAGKALAKILYEDAISVSDDVAFLTFELVLTGDSEKGKSKTDIKLIITKDKGSLVVDQINASLKVYKKYNVSLLGTSVSSYFDNMGMTLTKYMSDKIQKQQSLRRFVWQAYQNDELRTVKTEYGKEVWKAIKPMFKTKFKKDPKKNLSSHTPTAEQKILINNADRELGRQRLITFKKTFDKEYKKNKKAVNKKMLEKLGFSKGEDFYMAVVTTNGIEVLSSRTSDSYKNLIEKLYGKFDLSIIISDKSKTGITLFFKDSKGVEILKVSLSFGFSSHTTTTRITSFANFSSLKKDARKI